MGKLLTNKQFIEKSKQVHGENAFIYDEHTNYIGQRNPITIKCAKCGRYITVNANNHLNGHGCPYCSGNRTAFDTESFKEVTRKIHNNKYDDSELEYKGSSKKVKLICNEVDGKTGEVHGPFWIQARHYLSGCGCAKCSGRTHDKQLEDEDKPDGRKLRKFTKMPFSKFFKKATSKYGNKFTYFEEDYKSYYEYMKIKCEHGHEFYQIPYKHIFDAKCPYCAGTMLKTFDDFKEENKKVHGDEDLSLVEFKNYSTPVAFVCHKIDEITGKEHGVYWQKPITHLKGSGCPKCSGVYSPTMPELIEKFNIVHNNLYTYLDKEYLGYNMQIHAICKEHGEFEINLQSHLKGKGCPYCGKSVIPKHDFNTFRKMAQIVHGDKYIYKEENFEIPGNPKKTGIICKEHGLFIQDKSLHLQGHGCPHCSGNARINTEQFKNKVRKIYGDLYDLSEVDYKNAKTPVTLICPKHGKFKKDPYSLLRGSGCPHCSQSKLEESVEKWLNENNIKFEREYRYPELGHLRYDFFIEDINLLIECQGGQHFDNCEFFDKYDNFEARLTRDFKKYNFAKDNDIGLFYLLPKGKVDYLNERFHGMYSDNECTYRDINKLSKAVIKRFQEMPSSIVN